MKLDRLVGVGAADAGAFGEKTLGWYFATRAIDATTMRMKTRTTRMAVLRRTALVGRDGRLRGRGGLSAGRVRPGPGVADSDGGRRRHQR